ncbi:isopentenyl-diphosphate delta-isomerase [Plantibacter sp. Leaf171]|uniref:isopentenyl-diphosphate Delta-isomerase n=1 Tax=unclassified Plantibacter TaxID=2624265 RepID=UPI0006FCB81A|nr:MULTISPECIES: isopentenyl-diphosphate Delta-isomerase [unclassified Plantibacter]KQM16190.1 isopentenyl-diphosphate delta-isomerase [Plantibacter sp. Leaf1]KQR59326.1 isopentenyl-diphosphate delta-isomerase [Plantibacter sp. Leaf171]
MSVPEELVVLLAEDGTRIGTTPKATVHTQETPLHLAFSCHVIGPDGRILVTRRALSKLTWPGVWTNSFCGHPGPEEDSVDAVLRRASAELGLPISAPHLVLPDFRYRAVDASGVVEYEICPVYVAYTDAVPEPNPAEVMEWAWAEPASLLESVERAPFAFSPWLTLQLPLVVPLLAETPAR